MGITNLDALTLDSDLIVGGTLTVSGAISDGSDITLANGKAIQTDTTTAHTAKLKAYDVDGTAYKTFATLTNGNTPVFDISAPAGGSVTIDGAVIGGVTAAAGSFSTLNASGLAALAAACTVGTTLGVTGLTTTAGVNSSNHLTMTAAAKGLVLKQGANGKCGTFVCNGATPVSVSNTSIAITDTIIASLNTVGGTVGAVPAVVTITAGVGFDIKGTASDTSTYNYVVISNAA